MASPPGFRAAYLLLALLLLTLSVSACDCGMHCPYFTARQCLRLELFAVTLISVYVLHCDRQTLLPTSPCDS
ncbi:hypothetical protein QR680_009543 [Steinernema hermaphroditum]|uniref:Secreted protein n=1 Tax=Steinernema hermaphroditum TaxID=289476 RepID=A0AA39M9X4_9BILA|nr:hypothetical protein QR680_009543 [Steinernema hermaphroditum]